MLERCVNDEVRKQFQFYFDRYAKVVDDHKTNDLSDSQPTKGNIEGGLTTIEEKALGNIQKIGRKAPVVGCLEKAEAPTGPGLWFQDSSSAAAENGHSLRRFRIRGAFFSYRPGQHYRQSHPACNQNMLQSPYLTYHERAL